MKRKTILKILNILILLIIILFMMSNISKAGLTDIVNPTEKASKEFEKPMNVIIGLAQVIATGLGAIMLVALGIKYVSAAPGDKAEIKKHAVVYIVGACIAFSAVALMEIFQEFVKETLA